MKNNIVLIGYRGSGKTTVGNLLSAKLNYNFIDADEYLVKDQKMSIPEIVDKYGWNYFRNIETRISGIVSKKEKTVISTGGGIILKKENMNYLKSSGWIVYLKAATEIIYNRIKDSNDRPSLTGEKSFLDEIKEVLKSREHLYNKYADYIVNTDNFTPENICEVIADEYKRI